MQLFGSLKLLMALLGSSCPLFGRSGSKMIPKIGPKSGPKSDQKVVQKITPKITKKVQILGPEMDPKMDKNRFGRKCHRQWGLLKNAYFQDAPKMAQDGPKNGPR